MNPGLPIWENFKDFGIMLLAGIIVAAFFDLFRGFRKAVAKNGGKNRMFAVQLQDLIFAVCAFFFLLLLIYKINDGIIRSYIVCGFGAGLAVYAFSPVNFVGRIFYGIFYCITLIVCKIRTFGKKIFKKRVKKGEN